MCANDHTPKATKRGATGLIPDSGLGKNLNQDPFPGERSIPLCKIAAIINALMILKIIFENKKTQIATLVKKINTLETLENPNIPKVVLNAKKEALYFSRAPIPHLKDLKKERNQFRVQKELFEDAYKDLYDDSFEAEYNSQILTKILEQFDPYEFDLEIKKNNKNLEYAINSEHSFSNNKIKTKVFSPQKNILLYGIANQFPASGYLETYNNNLILISASGVLAYSNEIKNNTNDLYFKQIKTNISKFISEEQFRKSRIHDFDWLEGGWFSIKDVNIYKDQIYVSYTREVKENCWNTSLLHGKMNLKLIIFQNLFTSEECVHFYDNIDGEFNAHQSGGRIINVDDQNLFFSTGDFRSRFRAQKEDSIFSKIIEINKITKDYKVVSMGHRNPQGLYYNKKNNFLLEAEHGPEGGDEINLIELSLNKIPNYGWAISSYGEHYGGKNAPYNKKKYIKR